MEVQIFGTRKSAETRKALRFFAERRVKTPVARLPWSAHPHTAMLPPSSTAVVPHFITPPRSPAGTSCSPSTVPDSSPTSPKRVSRSLAGDHSKAVPPKNRTLRSVAEGSV